MTKYGVEYVSGETSTGIALFADSVPIDAIADFCRSFIVNPMSPAADNIVVVDLDTGEVVYDTIDAWRDEEDYNDYFDECGFNPYIGAYDYDC